MYSNKEMQPIKILSNWLQQNANDAHYLFSLPDLRALFPDLTDLAFKTLLSRAVRSEYLERVCRGLYTVKNSIFSKGLFRAVDLVQLNLFILSKSQRTL
jgi:predicted transcriptional regulator of viral defense system